MEEIRLRDGRIENASFTDYLLPTILDVPPVEAVLVEEPEPGTPFGAKGVGEPANVVAPAAIAAALRAATGRELRRIPVRPDELAGLSTPGATPPWPPVPEVPGPQPMPAYAGVARTGEVPPPPS
jgi:CO/xanthine dehydrogenase Mo-binding subunit